MKNHPVQELTTNPAPLGICSISYYASYLLTMILSSVPYLAPLHVNVHVWVLNLWRTLVSIKYVVSEIYTMTKRHVDFSLWYNFSQVPFYQWDLWLWRNSRASLSQCQFPNFESIVMRMCNRVLNNTWRVAGSWNTSILNMSILKTEDKNKQRNNEMHLIRSCTFCE